MYKTVGTLVATIALGFALIASAGREYLESRLRRGSCFPGSPRAAFRRHAPALHMIFDPLVRWNQDLGFDARLAERWERLDEKTVRFYLRQGVKFHSGNEMTAHDVVWTYERLKRRP